MKHKVKTSEDLNDIDLSCTDDESERDLRCRDRRRGLVEYILQKEKKNKLTTF